MKDCVRCEAFAKALADEVRARFAAEIAHANCDITRAQVSRLHEREEFLESGIRARELLFLRLLTPAQCDAYRDVFGWSAAKPEEHEEHERYAARVMGAK